MDRPSAETLQSDELKQSLVRQYLLARFGIPSDLAELESRWGRDGLVFWMSDQSIYEAFIKKEAQPLQQVAQQDNFRRDVFIQKLNRKESRRVNEDAWYAELKFKDTDRVSTKERISYWAAEIAVMFRPLQQGLTWQDRLKNPLGFTVVNFGLRKLEEPGK